MPRVAGKTGVWFCFMSLMSSSDGRVKLSSQNTDFL